jgi:DNA polymerase-1
VSTLVIVDGHNFLFKAFSVPFKFYSPHGTALHVATTFLSLLRRSLKVSTDSEPSLMVIFDAQGATTNSVLSEDYKANRKDYSQEEDSPFVHLPIIKAVLDHLEITWLEQPGTEADDLVASIATRHIADSANKVLIASNDSDFFQLICDQINIVRLKNKMDYDIVNAAWLVEQFGVSPQDYVELKSWVGDKADNIEGIAGVGWKRGLEILSGTRKRELSPEEEEKLALNRKLIKLTSDLEVICDFCYPDALVRKANKEIFEAVDGD